MSKSLLKKSLEDIEITQFMSVPKLLNAIFQGARRLDPAYTHVEFSKDLGLGSANAHSVMSGSRSLGIRAGQTVSHSLGLSKKETKYLLALIEYAKAKDPQSSKDAFEEILKQKSSQTKSTLSQKQIEFFSFWANAAILELLSLEGAEDRPDWIQKHLHFPLTLPRIKNALSLLEELGYIRYSDSAGRRVPTNETVSSGDQVIGFALEGFHHQMIDLAKSSIRNVHYKKRDIASLTISLSSELREEFQKELIALRKSFLKRSQDLKHKNEIVQVNFQIFPIATIPEGFENE